ncbi:MAG: SUMF1/EgtB/PvdO family nonheme iron enzyme [Thermoanaerobaculia bacterium]|nr:SUMF1/EgtB/PvdO family nonheme iron enzyme [Thermoanaerobaculia bacterium]
MREESAGLSQLPSRSWLFLSLLVLCPLPLQAQSVTNVRAQQLPDSSKKVEVLYDLSGAGSGGATVEVAFSKTGVAPHDVVPRASSLSGDAGSGITNGTNKRIVWDAAAEMPAGTYGTTWQAVVSGGRVITVYLGPNNTVPLVLVKIPAGTFTMGSPEGEPGRSPLETAHLVTLTSDYYMGKYEVTQGQWKAVMGTNPASGYRVGDDIPVYHISWKDTCGGPTGSPCASTSFIGKMNRLLGTARFRLPTEAEWERAARGGTQTAFSFPVPAGWDLSCGSIPEAEAYMWWCGNSHTNQPVGMKQPNPYGLYDVHGNVWEWVADYFSWTYPSDPQVDPVGPLTGANHGIRSGGGVAPYGEARFCRSATRAVDEGGDDSIGFRLASSVSPGEADPGYSNPFTLDLRACTATLSPPGPVQVAAAGATGLTFQVQTEAGCAWTATSNASWVKISAGASGTGTGTVTYGIDPNTSTSTRSGTITAAGQTLAINQLASSGPVLSVTPASLEFTASPEAPLSTASRLSIRNLGAGMFSWTLSADVPWLLLPMKTGTGDANIDVSADGTGLAAGWYTGTLSVTATGAQESPKKIAVRLGVVKPVHLSSGHVAVHVSWRSQYSGESGMATPIPQGDGFAFFYFSDANNPEVFVKVLDFGATSPYLVFYAGLTDFEYAVTFTNVTTGRKLSFTKPAGSFAGGANNQDLPHAVAQATLWSRGGEWSQELKAARTTMVDKRGERLASAFLESSSPAAEGELLLSRGRVAVSVSWRSQYTGQTGQATPLPQKDEFGYFYFSDASNPEVFVKVLDFGASSPYLIFYAGLTDFEYTVTFKNVQTGQSISFSKEAGSYNGGADNAALKH